MRAPNSSGAHRAAFTLLEVIISITVFSFIMVSVLSCWKVIVTGKIVSEQAAAAAQRARIGIKSVEEALECAEISQNNIQYYAFLTDTSEKFASLSLAARLPAAFPGSPLFGDNVIRRVTFDVERGNDGHDNLVMTQSPLLEAVDAANPAYPIILARDVNIFTLEFWSTNEDAWVVAWEGRNGPITNQLPPSVRVTLGCGHSAEQPDTPYVVYVREVAIPAVAH